MLIQWSLRGSVAQMLDSGFIIREMKLHTLYNDHFRTNTNGKGMSPFLPPAIG